MRQDSGGLWGYVWMVLTGFFTGLTPQDVMFGLGALITAVLGLLTYISNDRRNKRIAAAAEARNDILKRYVANREGLPVSPAATAAELDALQEFDA